jgi:hypothetical protein
MSERRLRAALRAAEPPAAEAAQIRALEVVRSAHAARPVTRRAPRRALLRVAAAALAIVAVAVALALTPPGEAVADWVTRIVDPPAPAPPALQALPASGRLLVRADGQLWLVERDGDRRSLGRWDGATFSPRGLYVAAWRGRRLAALDPRGHERWAIVAPRPVTAARWSPEGFHVVYLAGRELRVVGGDGGGDQAFRRSRFRDSPERLAADRVQPVAPAFRPGSRRTVAFVSAANRFEIVDTFTGNLLWRSGTGPQRPVRSFGWRADGNALFTLSPHQLRILGYGTDGRIALVALPPGRVGLAGAYAPRGRALVVSLWDPATRRSELLLVTRARNRGTLAGRRLFGGAGRLTDVRFSPDGSWVLAAWPRAGQWVLLRADGRGVGAVRDLRGRFGAFPEVDGWCCGR